jgi:hypothetical protein
MMRLTTRSNWSAASAVETPDYFASRVASSDFFIRFMLPARLGWGALR